MADDHPTGENPPSGSRSPDPDEAAGRREGPERSTDGGTAEPGEIVAGPVVDETALGPAVDETRAGPPADQTASLSGTGRPAPAAAWSGRAAVPPPGYHGGGADEVWAAEGPQPGSWWLPVVLGLLALVILGVLAVGVWLIADSLQDGGQGPVEQTSTSPSPPMTESPTPERTTPSVPPSEEAPTRSPAPQGPTPTPEPTPLPTAPPVTLSPPSVSPTVP